MAALSELVDLRSNDVLGKKIEAACAKKAYAIALEATPSPTRLSWAQTALQDPRAQKDRLFWAILAAHADLTTVQITGASDSAVETAVSDIVDVFWP